MSSVSRNTVASHAAQWIGDAAPKAPTSGRLGCYSVAPAHPDEQRFLERFAPRIGIPTDGDASPPVALPQ